MFLDSFPSPIGELHFSIKSLLYIIQSCPSFPSPIGELHFSIIMHPPVTGDEKTVSVPYRGATFLNILCGLGFMISRIMFPSPIGELHFSIRVVPSSSSGIQFPSPIGELHFSISYIFMRLPPLSLVSVPYRGATFLNRRLHVWLKNSIVVSVPYRGATFLN